MSHHQPLAPERPGTSQTLQTIAQNMYDLRAFSSELDLAHLDSLMARALSTTMTMVGREMPDIDAATVSGAALLLADDGEPVVHAAVGAYERLVGQQLPPALQAGVTHAVERRVLDHSDEHLAIPLSWNDRTLGVLLLTGRGLPTTLSDSLAVLVNHVSAVLETSVLYQLAAIDTTTRVFTRAFIIQRLYESLKSTFRIGQDITVLMMDLDRFKEINDTYGHLTGDRVLRDVGVVLKNALRETDVLGRYGGDEFLVVLPNTPIAGGIEVARRIRRDFVDYCPPIEGTPPQMSISIGIGGLHYDESDGMLAHVRPGYETFQKVVDMVISQADGLMYRAKHQTPSHVAAGHPQSWYGLLVSEGLLEPLVTE